MGRRERTDGVAGKLGEKAYETYICGTKTQVKGCEEREYLAT